MFDGPYFRLPCCCPGETISRPSATDDELARLLGRCAARDRFALHPVYEAMAPVLYGLALRLLRNRALAQETLQEAFLQIWSNAGRFDPERGSARAWMIGILRYRALDRIGGEARYAASGEMPEPAEDVPVSAEDREALFTCLSELPETSRRCITLAYVEGMSHQEIATHLGHPLGSVKSWILRGLGTLKKCMER